MKVRILGSGTSTGVPRIGNDWGRCDPAEPRNQRMRSSILVEEGGTRLLVDCGPDLRRQLLDADVGAVTAVIVTHDHSDHVNGIDELRALARNGDGPVPIHSRAATLRSLESRFAYAFTKSEFYRPIVEGIELVGDRTWGELHVRTVDQPHGDMTSLGMTFSNAGRRAGYAIDFNVLTDEMASLYEGCDLWVADCLSRNPHPTHAHLDAVVGWARDLNVGQLVLSHMGNGLDYRTLIADLPDWAAPGHDGMEILL